MRRDILIAIGSGLLSHATAQSLGSAIASQDSFSYLYNALVHHDLLETLNAARNSTYFAPNNDALQYLADFGINLTTTDPAIAKAIVLYGLTDGVHSSQSIIQSSQVQLARSALFPPLFTNVTDGQALKIRTNGTGNGAGIVLETGLQILTKVVETDIPFDHGVMHGTSTNMVLPHNVSETAHLGHLDEFLHLLQGSGLEAEVNALADATVFIPHDKAISGLRPALDMMSKAQLAALIANHVVPNHVLYDSTLGGSRRTVKTLGGAEMTIERTERGQIVVNNVSVVRRDVLLYGGVGHIIDRILFAATGEISNHSPSLFLGSRS